MTVIDEFDRVIHPGVTRGCGVQAVVLRSIAVDDWNASPTTQAR
jgi:hypothetical protein